MRCPKGKVTSTIHERYAVSLQHLIHRFAVPLPPLGKANASAGLIACSPNDMPHCFDGGTKAPPYDAFVSYAVQRMICDGGSAVR